MTFLRSFLLLIAAAFTAAMLFSCRNSIEEIQALQGLDSLPVESVTEVNLSYSDSGIIKARLQTPLMERFTREEPYLEMPKGLHVDFYDAGGNIVSWMDAGYAIKYEDENVFEARDSVIVINERGDKLNTEKLFWNRKDRTIYTDKHVTITRGNELLLGTGMEADEAFDNWKILLPSGIFYINDGQDSTATKDSMDPAAE